MGTALNPFTNDLKKIFTGPIKAPRTFLNERNPPKKLMDLIFKELAPIWTVARGIQDMQRMWLAVEYDFQCGAVDGADIESIFGSLQYVARFGRFRVRGLGLV